MRLCMPPVNRVRRCLWLWLLDVLRVLRNVDSGIPELMHMNPLFVRAIPTLG